MEPLDPPPSLIARLGRWQPSRRRAAWLSLAIAAALIALVTWNRPRAAPPAMSRAAAAPAALRPAAGSILATFAAVLPAEARFRRIGVDPGGRLTLDIEVTDPEELRAALAHAGPLAALRAENEAAVPDHGYRVRLSGPLAGTTEGSRTPGLAGTLRQRAIAAALLVETIEERPGGVALALSGPEPAVLRLAAGLGFRDWRLEADGGAVRLSGLALGFRLGTPPPTRTLFTVDEAPRSGGPELAGIVGRLPDDAVALVRLPDGRARTIAVGGAVDGWTLAALSADAAIFTRGGERLRVGVAGGDEAP